MRRRNRALTGSVASLCYRSGRVQAVERTVPSQDFPHVERARLLGRHRKFSSLADRRIVCMVVANSCNWVVVSLPNFVFSSGPGGASAIADQSARPDLIVQFDCQRVRGFDAIVYLSLKGRRCGDPNVGPALINIA